MVYRAEDLRLGRVVAIKVLRPEFVGNAEQVTRFENEARAAAALPRFWRLSSEADGPLRVRGDEATVGGSHVVVTRIDPVNDGEQGRYNLVYRVAGDGENGPSHLYAKRFLLPETAHLEAFAHAV